MRHPLRALQARRPEAHSSWRALYCTNGFTTVHRWGAAFRPRIARPRPPWRPHGLAFANLDSLRWARRCGENFATRRSPGNEPMTNRALELSWDIPERGH